MIEMVCKIVSRLSPIWTINRVIHQHRQKNMAGRRRIHLPNGNGKSGAQKPQGSFSYGDMRKHYVYVIGVGFYLSPPGGGVETFVGTKAFFGGVTKDSKIPPKELLEKILHQMEDNSDGENEPDIYSHPSA